MKRQPVWQAAHKLWNVHLRPLTDCFRNWTAVATQIQITYELHDDTKFCVTEQLLISVFHWLCIFFVTSKTNVCFMWTLHK